MEIKYKIIINIFLLIIVINNYQINIVQALTHNDYKQPITVDCTDGVNINFDASTFDEPVEISCDKVNQNQITDFKNIDHIVSPVYNLEILSINNEKKYIFFRKEATINFPKNLLVANDNSNVDRSVFFYDSDIKDWVSYNTNSTNNFLQAKLMHMGNFAVFDKVYDTNIDIYKTIAFYVIIIGVGASIIYAIIKK